jgi:hypothetical protein
MSAWICCYSDGKAAAKIVPPRLRTPSWTGLGAESEEKREPASDIEAAVVDSLKVLDPERPIREAEVPQYRRSPRALKHSELSYSAFASELPAGGGKTGAYSSWGVARPRSTWRPSGRSGLP